MGKANYEGKRMYSYRGSKVPLKIVSESGIEELYYPALYEGIPEEIKRYAADELNETENNTERGIKELKEFALRENIQCSDELLMVILRWNKFDFEKSKPKLKNFMKIRETTIDSLFKLDKKKIEAIINDIIFGILPYRDKVGRLMIFTKQNFNLEMYKPDDVVTCAIAGLMFALTYPMTSICGLAYIVECKCPSQFTLFRILNKIRFGFISLLRDFPIRYGRLDVINEIFLIRWFFNALYPFLPKKLVQRISFHGAHLPGLHKNFDVDILPTEFGGTLGTINNENYREEILDFILKLRAEHQQ